MTTRTATVPAFAKLNLSLLVLGKRPDGYHELRTVFQTISLADKITFGWTPGPRWQVEATPEIDNNLCLRAADLLRQYTGLRGRLTVDIRKNLPMGGGLGGGSSNAAATLLALPALAGITLPSGVLHDMATQIGSDVPFFLDGGTSLALGRGEELYPLPTPREKWAVVVTPGISVSTPAAFRTLNRGPLSALTFIELSNKIKDLRAIVSALSVSPESKRTAWRALASNDFEDAVFRQHPQLGGIRQRLSECGAVPARMSGSGSTLYGVFANESLRKRALKILTPDGGRAVRFLSAPEYRTAWFRALGEHKVGNTWPPHSRYAKS
jgi:4-diphosphocytidyl-2-C-methyl-D-erythritol kinase